MKKKRREAFWILSVSLGVLGYYLYLSHKSASMGARLTVDPKMASDVIGACVGAEGWKSVLCEYGVRKGLEGLAPKTGMNVGRF